MIILMADNIELEQPEFRPYSGGLRMGDMEKAAAKSSKLRQILEDQSESELENQSESELEKNETCVVYISRMIIVAMVFGSFIIFLDWLFHK